MLEMELKSAMNESRQEDCEMIDACGNENYYEAEIRELHGRIGRLEAKNKEYLDLFCGGNQQDIALVQSLEFVKSSEGLDASAEALQLLQESLDDLSAKSAQIDFLKSEVNRWQSDNHDSKAELDLLKLQLH
jgi:prefoldin subunit 5